MQIGNIPNKNLISKEYTIFHKKNHPNHPPNNSKTNNPMSARSLNSTKIIAKYSKMMKLS